MKEHIRTDTFKVFVEDDEILQQVMSDNKIKQKSEAYRKALSVYKDFSKASDTLEQVVKLLEKQSELISDLYFKIDTLSNNK
jgi:transcriptional regulator NrdR family protein